jgi:FLYWCH zinc finger domain
MVHVAVFPSGRFPYGRVPSGRLVTLRIYYTLARKMSSLLLYLHVCNFVNKSSIMAAELVNTIKGGKFLIVDQFLYDIDRNIRPIRIWKCKTHGCWATAKTDGGQLVCASSNDAHEHVNDDVEIRHLRFEDTVKTMASSTVMFFFAIFQVF